MPQFPHLYLLQGVIVRIKEDTVPKKAKLSNSPARYLGKKNKKLKKIENRDSNVNVHSSLLTVVKRWTHPKHPSIRHQMWSSHYPAIKRNEALTHATTQMNPEDMLSKRSSHKDHTVQDSICRKCHE